MTTEELLRNLTEETKRALAYLRSAERDQHQGQIPSHIADSSSGDTQAVKAQIECLESKLALIAQARSRFSQGLYGVCTSCGKQIPLPRLQAIPYALLCVRCQEELERNGRRPISSEKKHHRNSGVKPSQRIGYETSVGK